MATTRSAKATTTNKTTAPETFVGIDVSKARLEVASRGVATQVALDNTPSGIAQLVTRLRQLKPRLIVLEATGGYEMGAVAALAEAGLPVVVVNPRQVRDFARATGELAKTDQIDAAVIAHFGEAIRPKVRELPGQATRELAAVLTRRRQLVEMLTAERNRLGSAATVVRENLLEHIRVLERMLADTDDDLSTAVKQSPVWREQDELVQSVKGVGDVTSRVMAAHLPELGQVSNKQIAKLVGVAPLADDSGPRRGQRHIFGGRAQVRDVL